MFPWLKTALLWTTVATTVGVGAYMGAPKLEQMIIGGPPSSSEDFTKSAYDQNGNPITGAVTSGQIIQYVLRTTPPTNGSSGPATINDILSANQTYVASSMSATGWTLSTPIYNSNQETYTNPGFGPGTGYIMTVPPPGNGTGSATGATGDGFQPIPVAASGRVYSVWHHKPDPNGETGSMCWNLSDLSQCAGFPKPLSATAHMITPAWPHAGVVGAKFYFPAGREQPNNTTADLGIACWDTTTELPCPFITLPGNPSFARVWTSSYNSMMYGGKMTAYLAGLATDPAQPTHLIVNAGGQLYCIDATTSLPCPAWVSSPPLASGVNTNDYRDLRAEEGPTATRVFVEYNGHTASPSPRIACRLLSTGANCPGWPLISGSSEAVLPSPVSAYLTLSVVPDASGTGTAAACDHQASQGPPHCVKAIDGSVYAMPPIFTTATGPFDGTPGPTYPFGNGRYEIAAFHFPGSAQVLYPLYISQSVPYCFDFNTSAQCVGFTPAWNSDTTPNSLLSDARDYGYAADPTDPQQCFLGLGDHEIVWRFRRDGAMGPGVCSTQHVEQTFHLDQGQYCFHKPTEATWTTIDILNRPSQLVGGTITIKDSTGAIIETIPVGAANSYSVNLSAMGANSTVTVEFVPNYGSSNPPTTAYQLKLNYTANEAPQICYQAQVTGCGEVSNTATLHDDLGTFEARVDLGPVVGGECPPATPNCLELTPSITPNPNGSGLLTLLFGGPPGFTSKLVTVTSLTNGVIVTPPSQTFNGQTQGSWALTGLVPGMVVSFKVDAVDVGAGSKPGTDACCSSTIEVTVPDDHQVSDKIDLSIEKTGVPTDDGLMLGHYAFTLAVTNAGAPFDGQNAVVVSDVVPAGMIFTNAAGTDWNCGPVSQFPIAGGGALTCTYVGTTTLASGALLPPITVNAQVTGDPTHYAFQNCASVAIPPDNGHVDSNETNNKSCYSDEHMTSTHKTVPVCDKATTRVKGESCACLYSNMLRKSETACRCPAGQSLVQGKGCEKKSPICDKWSAKLKGESCVCLYEGMSRLSATSCGCPSGDILIKGVGCIVPRKTDVPTPSTTSCAEGMTMGTDRHCVPVCKAPMVLNAAHDGCGCPDGMELSNGTCTEKGSSFLGDVLSHVHVGIGISGSGGGSGGSSGGGKGGP